MRTIILSLLCSFGLSAQTAVNGVRGQSVDSTNTPGASSLPLPTGHQAAPDAIYAMTDSTTTVLTDSSGNANNGTMTGTPTVNASGVLLNGTTQYASLPAALLQFKTIMLCSDNNYLTNLGQANWVPLIGNSTSTDFHLLSSDSQGPLPDNGPTVYWPAHGDINNTKSAQGVGPAPGCFTYDRNTTNDLMWINGLPVSGYMVQTAEGANTVGGTLQLGGSTDHSWFFKGTFYYAVVWVTNRPTSQQIQLEYAYVRNIMTTRGIATTYTPTLTGRQLLAVGDSITALANGWPTLLSNTQAYTTHVLALSGRKANVLMQELPAIAPVYATTGALNLPQKFNVIVDFSGTNDFCSASGSPQAVINQKISTAAALRAAGWYWIEVSALSRGGGCDADTQLWNALLAANATNFDAYVDLHQWALSRNVFDMTAPGANASTTYFSDTIHPTAGAGNTGSQIIANAINDVLNRSDMTVGGSYTYTVYQGGTVAGALQTAHAIYDFSKDGGTVGTITPVLTSAIPATAQLVGGLIKSTTAVTSGGAGTISIGTSAGSSATSILGATAVTTFTTGHTSVAVPTFSAPVAMSAAGNLTLTVGTAALTAGVVEIIVFYTATVN